MRTKAFWWLVVMVVCSVAMADRPILLVTPQGVYQSIVTDGVPGPWQPAAVDVIVQGFGGTGGGGSTPQPPVVPEDADTKRVAEISKAVLKNADEATAAASLVDTLSKLDLQDADFKEALTLAVPVADTTLQAGGRLVKWAEQVLVVTADPAKLKAGVIAAFPVRQETLDTIRQAAMSPAGTPVPDGAIDWQQLIQVIQMIITLLKNLQIIR